MAESETDLLDLIEIEKNKLSKARMNRKKRRLNEANRSTLNQPKSQICG